jgi:hypothetical protein
VFLVHFKAALTLLLICLLLPTSVLSFPKPTQAQNGEYSSMQFGVNYLSTHIHYEQYYLPNQTLDRDFALFKQQGLTYVTLVAVWKYIEPQLGVYTEEAINDLIRVCTYAEKYDLKVNIDFYTMMSNNSWTMPEWLSNRKFETVFLNNTARQAWLNYLGHVANRLDGQENIYSWHMMNEPARREWACNVSIEGYLDLWSEMKRVFKAHSDRPVSVRFAAQVFEDPNHFNSDPKIFEVLDYLALNWYENHCPRANLTRIVNHACQYTQVMISEFGNNTADDAQQAQQYLGYVEFFRNLGLKDCIAWMWRADYNSANPEPPGTGFNLAKDTLGTPRSAFYYLDGQPPIVNIISLQNKICNTNTVPLVITLNENTTELIYKIDSQANATITGNTTLSYLPEGQHTITVYAKDPAGNWGTNSSSFTINVLQTLFNNGFETKNFNIWSGTRKTSGETTTISTTHFSGKYSAKFTSNGGRATEYSYCYKTVPSSAQINATGYYYISKSGLTQRTGTMNLITLNAGSNTVITAGLTKTAGTLRWSLTIRNGSEAIVLYSTQTPVLNQWCKVEVDWLKDATSGYGLLLVDGSPLCLVSGINTSKYGNVTQACFGLTQLNNCYSTTIYIDNCTIIG